LTKHGVAAAVLSAALVLTTVAGASSRPVRIGIVLKGLDNPFFVTLYEGARAEAGRRHAVASFRATNVDDAAAQAASARALVRGGQQDCYVVNPLTGTNLIPAFRGAKRPVVNVDAPFDRAAARRAGLQIHSFIGTDDAAAGQLAAREMVSALSGRGEVALLDGYRSSLNSTLRLRGFTRGVAGTHVRIVANVTADYDRAKAQAAARRVLQEHPNVSGFFAANDVMALGIADVLQIAGKRGAVKVIGVDAIPPALDAVRAGSLTATVAQYPYVMGRMGIEACIAAVRGKALPARVNAPIVLVSRQNVGQVSAAFPLPPHGYDDPFARLLQGRR
jgi:ABC-type sugar transport system substrate-binding protein